MKPSSGYPSTCLLLAFSHAMQAAQTRAYGTGKGQLRLPPLSSRGPAVHKRSTMPRSGVLHTESRYNKINLCHRYLSPTGFREKHCGKKQTPFHFKFSGTKDSVAQQEATGLSGKDIWLTLVSTKPYRAEDVINEVYSTLCLESLTNNDDCLM